MGPERLTDAITARVTFGERLDEASRLVRTVTGPRLLLYPLATLVGLLPGTAAVVILGDALTGNVNPLLVLISVCTAVLGIAGLSYETRHYRRRHAAAVPDPDPDGAQAVSG